MKISNFVTELIIVTTSLFPVMCMRSEWEKEKSDRSLILSIKDNRQIIITVDYNLFKKRYILHTHMYDIINLYEIEFQKERKVTFSP